MGDEIEREAGVWKHHVLHEVLKVVLIIREAPHMAAAWMLYQPSGATLAAQVEGCDPQAPIRQFADGFEIFLDKLVAAMQQDDRALGHGMTAAENGIAQLVAVMGGEIALGPVVWNRVVGGRKEN